eukprot:2880874-Rhodomonas_salina.1
MKKTLGARPSRLSLSLTRPLVSPSVIKSAQICAKYNPIKTDVQRPSTAAASTSVQDGEKEFTVPKPVVKQTSPPKFTVPKPVVKQTSPPKPVVKETAPPKPV